MSASGDATTGPWTDPQTHLDTDPVNAEPTPAHPGGSGRAEQDDEDGDRPKHGQDPTPATGDPGPVEPS
ncbi:hypothetical protein SFC79_16385 [Nocardioides sp. S-58]|uniref:Uncharacterized protein n=1 Tax=Nocardioides renjunii TaxID=3095075 RepID=A0ABU5KEU9_9ACTN|nr:hypothetical protein [Nocardioides sp. S-58]MDZ5663353.1 hypothetical protein [Nocardioides sp. S-58]